MISSNAVSVDKDTANEYQSVYGALVREERKALGVTMEGLSRKAKICPAALSKIERGEAGISMSLMIRICYALEFPPSVMLAEVERRITAQ